MDLGWTLALVVQTLTLQKAVFKVQMCFPEMGSRVGEKPAWLWRAQRATPDHGALGAALRTSLRSKEPMGS